MDFYDHIIQGYFTGTYIVNRMITTMHVKEASIAFGKIDSH